MRIVTSTLQHETNTFTPVTTTKSSFYEQFGNLQTQQMIDPFAGTNSPLGGFIDGSHHPGFELIATIVANAHPSGPARRQGFDSILNRMLERIADAGPIDGVLLRTFTDRWSQRALTTPTGIS